MVIPLKTRRWCRFKEKTAIVSGAFLIPMLASAQTTTPWMPLMLDPVIIEGSNDIDRIIRRRFIALSGGVSYVRAADMPDSANLTIARALEQTPGVVIQNFFGGNDQPRIQIRGSGLQQNPVERSILMLQNGLPLNRADGSYVVGLADPGQAQALEIYRGYMANRISATVLGGAINMVSPTGVGQPRARLNLAGGSFDQYSASGEYGFAYDNVDGLFQLNLALVFCLIGFAYDKVDGLFQLDHSARNGFRDYNQSERTNLSSNFGIKLSGELTTRFFAGYTNLSFDVAGPVNKEILYKRPKTIWSGPRVTPEGPVMFGVTDPHEKPNNFLLVTAQRSSVMLIYLTSLLVILTLMIFSAFRFPLESAKQMAAISQHLLATPIIRIEKYSH